MKNFKNILIQVNEQSTPEVDMAVLRGIELAKRSGAKVLLFDVVEPLGNILSRYTNMLSLKELTENLAKQRLDQLTKVAQALQSEDVQVSAQVSIGKNFIEIVKAVIVNKNDLLIKVSNPSEQNFDSNDFHIIRKCPKPVWLIRETQVNKVKKIVAAVDLSMEEHTEGRAQNRMIMDIAMAFSQFENATLSVISCWQLYGERALRSGLYTKISHEELADLIKSEEHEYKKILDLLINEYTGLSIDKHLLKGLPKTLIPEYVNSNGVDIVVMGTIGRSGIPGLLIGNTSETVLQAINSSVITLKPEDFISPIQ
jgi:universal stress protein E